jgi:hypothetical protein
MHSTNGLTPAQIECLKLPKWLRASAALERAKGAAAALSDGLHAQNQPELADALDLCLTLHYLCSWMFARVIHGVPCCTRCGVQAVQVLVLARRLHVHAMLDFSENATIYP